MKDRNSNILIDVKMICQQLKLGNDQAFKQQLVDNNVHSYDSTHFMGVRKALLLVIQDYQQDPTCYEQYNYFSVYKLALTANILTIIQQVGRDSKVNIIFATKGIIDGNRIDLLNELAENIVPYQVDQIAEAMVYDCIDNPTKACTWLRELTNDSLKRSFIKIAKLVMPDYSEQLKQVYDETKILPEHFNIEAVYTEMLEGDYTSFIKLKKLISDYGNSNIWKFRQITNRLLYKHFANHNEDVLNNCCKKGSFIEFDFSLYLAGRAGDYAAARKITDLHHITSVMHEVRGYIDAGRFDQINKIVHMIGSSDCSMIVSEIINYGDYQQEEIFDIIPQLTEASLRLRFIKAAIKKFPSLEYELNVILNKDQFLQAGIQNERMELVDYINRENKRIEASKAFDNEIIHLNSRIKKSMDNLVNVSTITDKLSFINHAKIGDEALIKWVSSGDYYTGWGGMVAKIFSDIESATSSDELNQYFDDVHSKSSIYVKYPCYARHPSLDIVRDVYNRKVYYLAFTEKLAVALESIKKEMSQTTWQVAGLFSGWKDGVPDTIYKIKKILTAKNGNPDVMMADVARLLTKALANPKTSRHPDVTAAYHRWFEQINNIATIEPICTSDWLKSLDDAPVVNSVNALLKQAEWESMVDAVVPTMNVTTESLRVDPEFSFEMAAARNMFDDVSNVDKNLGNVSLEKSNESIVPPSHAALKLALQQYCERANSVASEPTAADSVADINAYLANKASAVQEKQEGCMQVIREPLVGLVRGVAKDILEQAEANSVSAALPAVPYHSLPLLFNTHVKNSAASAAKESDDVDAKQDVSKYMLHGM